MARSQLKAKRKTSGGRYHPARAKKKRELVRPAAMTKLGETKTKKIRIMGGNEKMVTLSIKEVNVTDKKGKTKKTEIVDVIENSANPHLVRRNIITKGAVIETKLGKAKVTSRPGQEGAVSAVLV
jgi:small subunit ribosomal protein S8e